MFCCQKLTKARKQKLDQAKCLFGRENTPSVVKRESVLHIINKLRSLVGEGRAASQSGEGSECCFWTAACFRSEVIARNRRRVQSFFPPLKANDSEILCERRRNRGREGRGSGGARSVLPRDDTPTYSGSSHNLTLLQKNMEISSRFGSRTS